MATICVNVPARLKENLKIKAMELNLKTSDVIRTALWQSLKNIEPKTDSKITEKTFNIPRKKALEEQIYFIRSLVENIGLIMDGGGEEFVDDCHLYKEKLLKKIRLQGEN